MAAWLTGALHRLRLRLFCEILKTFLLSVAASIMRASRSGDKLDICGHEAVGEKVSRWQISLAAAHPLDLGAVFRSESFKMRRVEPACFRSRDANRVFEI